MKRAYNYCLWCFHKLTKKRECIGYCRDCVNENNKKRRSAY